MWTSCLVDSCGRDITLLTPTMVYLSSHTHCAILALSCMLSRAGEQANQQGSPDRSTVL